MSQDAARLPFQVGDHVLIAHIEDPPLRKHALPMSHQREVAAIIPAKLRQIIVVVMPMPKQLGEARDAGVDRVADSVNDTGIGQREMDHPGEVEVSRHLIGYMRSGRRMLSELRHVAGTDLAQQGVISRWNEFRVWKQVAVGSVQRRQRLPKALSSPAPCTSGWLARICSTSVEPERGMPRTKMGTAEGSPCPSFSLIRAGVKTALMRSNSAIVLASS